MQGIMSSHLIFKFENIRKYFFTSKKKHFLPSLTVLRQRLTTVLPVFVSNRPSLWIPVHEHS